MNYKFWALFFSVLLLASCGSGESSTPPPPSDKQSVNLSFDFSESSQEFEISVADYAVEHDRNDEIVSTLSQLPEPYEYRKMAQTLVNQTQKLVK